MMAPSNLRLYASIPFLTEREAAIAYEVLRIDQEPPRSQLTKCIVQDKNLLNISFSATSPQQLRVGVNGLVDQITLLVETLEQFGPPVSLEYSHSLNNDFGLYLIWAVIPDPLLHMAGITYYPQKYWAIALPVYVLMGIAVFAFFIYPGLNLLLTPPLDCTKTVSDSYSVYRNIDIQKKIIDYKGAGEIPDVHGIPTASDIPISHVCRSLYLNK